MRIILLLAAFLATIFASLLLGPTGAPPPTREVLVLRASRVTAAASTGVILALAGLSLQYVLRSSLADPYLLGVSPAAYLAVVALALVSPASILAYHGFVVAALLGGLAGVALVTLLSRLGISTHTMILAGIAVSTTLSGLGYALDYIASSRLGWSPGYALFGGFSAILPKDTLILAAAAATYTAYTIARLAPRIEPLLYGDDAPMLAGVDARRARLEALVASGVAVAVATAYTGVIGFVGLIAPNVARRLVGVNAREAAVASSLVGGLATVMADTVARLVGPVVGLGEIPAGALIAVVGGVGLAAILARGAW